MNKKGNILGSFVLCLMNTERIVGDFESTEGQKRASIRGPGVAGTLGPLH